MTDKSKIITFRVTAEEEQRYKEQAEIAGLAVSELIRRKLNNINIEAKTPITDKQTIANIRQIGGLIKQLYKDDKITYNELKKSLFKIDDIIRKVKDDSQKNEK